MTEKEGGLDQILDNIVGNEKLIKKPGKTKQEKMQEKELKEKQKLRKMFLEKEHNNTCVLIDEHERELKKTAMKGVVQLFNAIAEHQHKLKIAEMKDETGLKDIDDFVDETVSKDDFFSKIIAQQQKERKEIQAHASETSKKIYEGSSVKKQKRIDEEKKAKEQKKIEKSKIKKEKRAERNKEKKEEEKFVSGTKKDKNEKKPKKNNKK
ncbi:hypothetical protein ENUP19_0257G0032 [Entamoeba nuttalli]|uniref:Uncharacterized protein n=2 Tax=Entamoeba nuttalli TaxID=412467 RepID=K2HQN8_ENTNP|nr:hypothetical protein ENU1_172210 [Entamoeba nuttalli P19]EKE38250.1 hypothetical protein ENU1_172210 [Entamoeba nuttalli P19]|eukprot:XP_008859402.1 hypothetical protein ENU1_172210 [Entamoeba nuttalli P19]